MSRNQRLTFLGIAAVIAVAAIVIFAVGSGSDDSSQDTGTQAAQRTATPSSDDGASTPTPTPTASPKPDAPLLVAGKVTKLEATHGETVRFGVRSDEAEEVHVHGYDLMKDLEAGETATMSFKATITGIFEIEFEHSAEQIAELRVDPK